MNANEFVRLLIQSVLKEEHDVDDKFLKVSFDAQIDKQLLQFVKSAEHVYDQLDYKPEITPPGEDTKKQKAEKDSPEKNQIDVDSFLTSVNELIENFENLIEIKTTIYRRAVRVLKQTQPVDVVNDFKEALKERNVRMGQSEKDFEAEEFRAPPAAGAGPGGGGAV